MIKPNCFVCGKPGKNFINGGWLCGNHSRRRKRKPYEPQEKTLSIEESIQLSIDIGVSEACPTCGAIKAVNYTCWKCHIKH